MTVNKSVPLVWVASSADLQNLATDLAREPRIAVDTESNSLHAYREQVCLIQFSTPTTDYLLDPLAVSDLRPLAPIFANPAIEKVFHAAEYDLICLQRDFDFKFANLFDTMVAARILAYQVFGLGKLLALKFNVQVDKKFQKANWGKRPLSDEMLNYARLDTHYLLELSSIMKQELRDINRWELAQEDFAMATAVNGRIPRRHCPSWERIGGGIKLDRRQATVLDALCDAREHLAERLNRPVFKVVSDKTLLKLSQTLPESRRDLQMSGLSQRQIDRFGRALLTAVRRGLQAPLVKRQQTQRPSDAFLLRLDALRNGRKLTASRRGDESDVILPS
ncbi:MAG: ribonuclease D, partial [Anaerolineales bacterium]|nr:ribonuclease D [Anaerolineales bacterium]